MHVILVAAENGALPGGKAGVLGDVIRGLPMALARTGHKATVITPGYGMLARRNKSELLGNLMVAFGCGREQVEVFDVRSPGPVSGVRHVVLEHPLFSTAGAGRIHVHDDAGQFATDANRFALFCAAAAETIDCGMLGEADVVHCHDWHAALLLLLRRFDPRLEALRRCQAVYTIHDLSLQGVRPLAGDGSTLEGWFPGLITDLGPIRDPRRPECINLMRAGINLADRVHAVSPGYGEEILRPSHWEQGRVGGEGLEADLQCVAREGRLVGILNGFDYQSEAAPPLPAEAFWDLVEASLARWAGTGGDPEGKYHFAMRRTNQFRQQAGQVRPTVVSIGRLDANKLYLMVQKYRHHSVTDEFLHRLSPGRLIMLGSGSDAYDRFFTQAMQGHENFLFLSGHGDELSNALYRAGDLFLMPSIIEPCGTSQMLAMQAGMPCLVHRVGGLTDTVKDGQNGFSFGGYSLLEIIENFLLTLDRALGVYREEPETYQQIVAAARVSRFTWESVLPDYLDKLYRAR